MRIFDTHSRQERRDIAFQFFKFGLVGLSNTLVAWACYYLFLWINGDLYMVGSIVGGILSIANAFFWNDRFVFKGGRQGRLKRLGKTYVSYAGTSILSNVLLWLEVRLLGVPKAVAPIVNLIVTIPFNFIINKLWTFKS